MKYQGKVTSWKDDKGFGFLTPNGGGETIFVHIKGFVRGSRRPRPGDSVTYNLATDKNGRVKAENVCFLVESAAPKAPAPKQEVYHYTLYETLFAALFCVLLITIVVLDKLPVALLGLYFTTSLLAFLTYVADKTAAVHKRWRIQESTLHTLSVLGGWPGALLAQRLLRHKSRKKKFQAVFWATVIINGIGLVWLFTPSGARFLNWAFLFP